MTRWGTAALVMVLFGCGRPRPTSEGTTSPQVTLFKVRFHYFQGGALTTVGTAEQVNYQRGSSDVEALRADVHFPDAAPIAGQHRFGAPGMDIRAQRIEGNLSTREADGFEGVRIRTREGLIADSRSAHFDGRRMVARGREKVMAHGPRFDISASAFDLDFLEEEFHFIGDVDSRIGGPK